MSSPSSSKVAALEEGLKVKRRPVALSGTALAVMSVQTLGIVYSDLATSPMFVLVKGYCSSSQKCPTLVLFAPDIL